MNKLLTNGWQNKNNVLSKEFTFKSYLKTIGFVNAIAWQANKVNHHPDLEISFNKCIVKLTTHDSSCLTEKDFELAHFIDSL